MYSFQASGISDSEKRCVCASRFAAGEGGGRGSSLFLSLLLICLGASPALPSCASCTTPSEPPAPVGVHSLVATPSRLIAYPLGVVNVPFMTIFKTPCAVKSAIRLLTERVDIPVSEAMRVVPGLHKPEQLFLWFIRTCKTAFERVSKSHLSQSVLVSWRLLNAMALVKNEAYCSRSYSLQERRD